MSKFLTIGMFFGSLVTSTTMILDRQYFAGLFYFINCFLFYYAGKIDQRDGIKWL